MTNLETVAREFLRLSKPHEQVAPESLLALLGEVPALAQGYLEAVAALRRISKAAQNVIDEDACEYDGCTIEKPTLDALRYALTGPAPTAKEGESG